MTRTFCRLLPALVLLALAPPLPAQQVRGVIRGTVTDATGGVLPGATVTVNSPANIQKDQSATTSAKGEFRFPLLDPGVYEVKVQLQGFATATVKGIRLLINQTLDVPVTLQLDSVAATIDVEATPIVDKDTTQLSVHFTKEVLQNIPSGRSINSILSFTPGATNDGKSGTFTINGASVRGNALQLDGVDVTDPTVGTQLVSFNFDNIEEIQIEKGGHKAEYGQLAGAVVNTVTKQGGNQFSGEGNVYFQDDGMSSKNGDDYKRIFDLSPNQTARKIDTQAQMGGPILKDRIWFYGSYGYLDEDTRVTGFPLLSNTNVNLGYGKVTWQLTPKNKFVGSFNYDSRTRDFRGAGTLTPPESTRSQTGHGTTPNLEFTSVITPTTYVQVRAAFVDSGFDLIPKNGEPAHLNLDTSRLEVSDGRIDINKRKRKQVVGSLSHYRDDWAGNHDFKFGFEYEDSDEFRDFTASQGLFYYDTGTTVSTPTYVYTIEDPPEKAAINRTSFYAQDSWSLSNRVTLNLGVRVDHNEGSFPEQAGPGGQVFPDKSVIDTTDISPRVGISFDLTGDGKTAARFTYSRIVGANITQYFSGINPNAISGQLRIVCGGPADPGGLCAPGERFSPVLAEFGASNTTIDDKFGMPLTDEYSVGFERELASNLSLGVNYIERQEKKLPETIDQRRFFPRETLVRGDRLVDDEGNIIETVPDTFIEVFDADLTDPSVQVITNPPEAVREYRALEFIVTKRMSKRWQMLGSFVISRSAGLLGTDFNGSSSISGLFSSPNGRINGFGNLNFHRPYVLKLDGTYEGPWGINLSAFYQLGSGTPYTRTARIPVQGLPPVTINAERLGSRRLKTLNALDLRIEKELKLPYGRVDLVADVFNLFNINTVTSIRQRTVGSLDVNDAKNRFGAPIDFVLPRQARVAARYMW